MSINVSTYSVISTFIPGDEGTSRGNVTVYTLTIQFRIDEWSSHGNEGLMTLTSTMKIH